MKPMKRTNWLAPLLISLLTIQMATPALAEDSVQTSPATQSVSVKAGNGQFGEDNGPAHSASFRSPMGIALHPDGSVYIADTKSHLIRKLFQESLSTYAGFTFSQDASGYPIGTLYDGSANLSVFQDPQGLALDASGNLYVADTGNHAVRKVTVQGVTTIAGDGVMGSRDGKTG